MTCRAALFLAACCACSTAVTSAPEPPHGQPLTPPADDMACATKRGGACTQWVCYREASPAATSAPALVYIVLDAPADRCDFTLAESAMRAGVAVVMPIVDEADAAAKSVAAARWVAARPEIDHVYAVGYADGGAVAAMMNLDARAPVRGTASIAGTRVLDVPDQFRRPREKTVLPHKFYIARDDEVWVLEADGLQAAAITLGRPFDVDKFPGSLAQMANAALERYVAEVIVANGD